MGLKKKKPIMAIVLVLIIVFCCIFAESFITGNPLYLNLEHRNQPPNGTFYFGTDAMGRDVYSMIWYGGRISLLIGFLAAGVSTVIGTLYGSISGFLSRGVDQTMMRGMELFLSIPSILVVVFLQAMIGQSDPVSIAFVIGISGWMNLAKVVRQEIRQLSVREYIIQVSCMGGSFFYLLRKHFIPELIPTILYMTVMNVGAAIATESTLSFMGIGLPLDIISWGTMLSQAENAMLSNEWWLILIPGGFLALLLICLTDVANYIRKENSKKCSNL